MRRLAAEHTPPGAGDFPGGAHNATLSAQPGLFATLIAHRRGEL